MIKGDAVLVLKEEGERLFIKTEYLTSDASPETLNGESGFHVYHVRKMTELILRKMGLDEETVIQMSIASSLHDIGKREVPKSILDFPGTLSPLQYDIIKKHSVFGEEIIKQADTSEIDEKIISYAKEIARNHHERIDGTGYPDGLKGESIPVSASAVAIADAFDALTSQRSYKDALSTDVALQMISSGMCGSFDEKLISALIAVVGDSALVEIRNKLADSRAVVSTAPLRPKKILLIGNTGYVNESFIEKAFPNGKVTVVGNTDLEGKSTLKLFKIRKPSVKAILETYEFDFIVYFSNDLSFGVEKKSDAEELRELLKYSVETGQTARIIHLASLESAFKNKSDSSILSSSKE
ncbi:MAG: HD domain-containing protein, partial [Clostridia bacterium]|nr:HD domain-containing protein [Clostridia bacterium]